MYVPGPTTEEECACLAKKVKDAVGASIKNEYCYAKFEKVGYTGRQSHYGCDFDDINDGEFKINDLFYFSKSKMHPNNILLSINIFRRVGALRQRSRAAHSCTWAGQV